MAESVKVIDPDSGTGYDYDSLFDWEAAQQADIDSTGTQAVAKCRCTGGTADTTAVTIDGWTTSADDYIKIWTDSAESYRHNGTYQTGNKYRLEVVRGSHGSSLLVLEGYTQLIGLQVFANGGAWLRNNAVHFNASASCVAERCISRGPGGATTGMYSAGFAAEGAVHYFINCLAYDFTTGDGYESGFSIDGSGAITHRLYNCTIVNCTYGVYAAIDTDHVLKNVGISGCTTAINDTGLVAQTTCSTSTPTFADPDNDDYHLASNDTTWLGQGTNLYDDANYPFQDDIDGDDRGGSGAQWDIGADEYVSAAGRTTKNTRGAGQLGIMAGMSRKTYLEFDYIKPIGGL